MIKQKIESYALGGTNSPKRETERMNKMLDEGWIVKAMVASGNIVFILYEKEEIQKEAMAFMEKHETLEGNERYIADA